jgi:hypothetical protein
MLWLKMGSFGNDDIKLKKFLVGEGISKALDNGKA